jgi:hypothetical protein
MFIDNRWYGNNYIFSKYCKTFKKKIFGSLQHGLIMIHHFKKSNEKKAKIGERTFQIIPWFVWSDQIQNRSRLEKSKNVFAIGSPFLYLHFILSKKFFTKSNEVLVIPPKSAFEINHNIDYQGIINFLKKKKFKKPFKILVGQIDLKKILKSKKKFDCKFVTCGNRNSKFYTFRLYRYLKEASSVVILYPGTPILYSLFLNKKTYYYQNRFLISSKRVIFKNDQLNLTGIDETNKNDTNMKLNWFKKYDDLAVESFKKDFGLNIFHLNSASSRKKASIALGINKIKSPNELKKILGWKNPIKILFGTLISYLINLRHRGLR